MGKRITSQARGRGTRRYIAPSHRYFAEAKHKSFNKEGEGIFGKILDLVHSVSHNAPIAIVKYDDGEIVYLLAPEGIAVGDQIFTGVNGNVKLGNTLTLENIPEGTSIYNVESKPGDGGKFIRSSGIFGKVVTKTGDYVKVLMPSKKEIEFSSKCRATIGVVAGGGRLEKPFYKAGKKWHALRARGKLYPVVSAVAKNAVDHPFGSGRGRHMGKPSIAPRFAPPGRKVGQQSPRRTGRKR